VRIGVEIRYIVEQHTGGITPLLQGVFDELCRSAPNHDFHFFGTIFNRGLFPQQGLNVYRYSLPLDCYWARLETLFCSQQIDVLFRSFPVDDPLKFPLSRQVCFVPDLQHEAYPSFFTPAELTRRHRNFGRLIEGCGAVGSLSEHARGMIREKYQNQFDDVFVMPGSSQFKGKPSSAPTDDPETSKIRSLSPFFYFPAKLWPHKNHALLLKAFSSFRTSSPAHENFTLVLSGDPKGWAALEADYDTTNVVHLGFVPRHVVTLLYQNATGLVFPSLFEGFGMPVLEAFGLGCPVISSNAASLPEVAGDAAILVDPNDAEEVARAMAMVSSDEQLRQSMIAKGRERFRSYSWAKPAGALRDAIERVHDRNCRVEVEEPLLVSIVTPSFNQGQFIGRTIESVLGQTYPNIEYRVVDGGSSDNTLEVLRSYGDALDWVSEPDGGQADAINKGFAKSKGEILAYLNSDDTLNRDAVETIVKLFRLNPGIGMIYGNANYIDTDDNVTGSYPTAEFSFERLMNNCFICQPAAFWTAEIAREIGPFDETLQFVMDYDYWLRMAVAGASILHVPVTLANSRLYSATKTLSSRPKIYQEIFKVCLRHGGYVGEGWIRGYLDCMANEERKTLFRVLSSNPKLQKRLLEYYSLRLSKPRLSASEAFSKVLRIELIDIGNIRLPIPRSLGKSHPEERRAKKPKPQPGPSELTPTRDIFGFLPEGYLQPKSRFISERIKLQQPLRLTGCSVRDTRVDVRSGGELILSKTLKAERETTLEFVALHDEVTITFEESAANKNGPRLAFRVTETNLFSEQELNAASE
jgi:glycosyltransferase involved in cell wall biosynthesis